jgi:DNA polymerase-3 subunit epsilon
MSLFEQPLAIVDLETTGGDPRVDRITEIGIVLIDGVIRREWSSLVNPDVSIPANIQRFIGITDAWWLTRRALPHSPTNSRHCCRTGCSSRTTLASIFGFLRNEFARLGAELFAAGDVFGQAVACAVPRTSPGTDSTP